MSEIKLTTLFSVPDKTLQSVRDVFIKMFTEWKIKYAGVIRAKRTIEPDTEVIIDWACGFNSPTRIGQKATVVMSDDMAVVVEFSDGYGDFYRAEDVTPL